MITKFLIGDIAKIHNISTQTLRYYDKINLLNPTIIDETNGYRYYTIDQFEKLNTIRYLKFLGMSLDEIKDQFEKSEIEIIVKTLEKQKNLTKQKIQQLEFVLNKIESKIHYMQMETYEIVEIKEIPERTITKIEIQESSSIVDIELGFKQLEKNFNCDPFLFTGDAGITISMDNLKKHKFERYRSLFISIDAKLQHESIIKLPKGKYACMYHRGPYTETYKSYEKLLSYIDEHTYEIIGDSIEVGLIDCGVILNENEYLTEIQIPIRHLKK